MFDNRVLQLTACCGLKQHCSACAHLKAVCLEAKSRHDVLCEVQDPPNLGADLVRQAEDVRIVLQRQQRLKRETRHQAGRVCRKRAASGGMLMSGATTQHAT